MTLTSPRPAARANALAAVAAGLFCACLVFASRAWAAVAAADAPPSVTVHQNRAPPATTVSGVTVTASRVTPRVVATFPASGATVAPGVLVLRVTYDTHMFDESWSYISSADGLYPDCAATPRRLDDKQSFVLICRTLPNKSYAVWFNQGSYGNFISVAHRQAKPFELRFKTSGEDPVWTLKDAMAQDKSLPAGANPVEPEGKRRPNESYDDPDG